MSLQLTCALRRLVTVPLYRSSVQGVRYATASPKQDGEREKPILQDVVECVVRVRVSFFAEDMIPGDMEQATGLEKKELDALIEGKEVGLSMYELTSFTSSCILIYM